MKSEMEYLLKALEIKAGNQFMTVTLLKKMVRLAVEQKKSDKYQKEIEEEEQDRDSEQFLNPNQ